jgi:hypothetical protein
VTSFGGAKLKQSERNEIRAADLPDFVVRKTEELVEVTPLDLATWPNTKRVGEGVRENLGSKYWESWVGVWVVFGSVDQPKRSTEVQLALTDGTVAQNFEISSPPRAKADRASLKMTSTLAGEAFLRSIGMTMDNGPLDFTLLDSSRTVTISATTDPRTLQPGKVTFEDNVRLTSEGTAKSQVETREWVFDWKKASCR